MLLIHNKKELCSTRLFFLEQLYKNKEAQISRKLKTI